MSIATPNYTQIPNDLLDLYMDSMCESELKVMLFILRKTVGYHRDTYSISIKKIADEIRMTRATVLRACVALEDRGLLISYNDSVDESTSAERTYEPNFEDRSGPPQHKIILQSEQMISPDAKIICDSEQIDAITYKEEERKIEINEVKKNKSAFPLPDVEDLDLEDPLEEFLTNSHRRMKRGKLRLNRKSDVPIVNRALELESRAGSVEFRAGWLDYLSRDNTALREKDWPLAWYLNNPDQHFSTLRAADPRSDWPPMATPIHSLDPVIPRSVSPPHRDFLAEWNVAVPPGMTEWDDGAKRVALLRTAEADPVFCEKFIEVCEVALGIHGVQGVDASWLDFYWILKCADGSKKPNWKCLLTNLRGMAKPRQQGKPDKPNAALSGIEQAMKNVLEGN